MKTFFKVTSIGALAGFFNPLLFVWLIILTSSSNFSFMFQTIIRVGIPCILAGIIGALIGGYWRRTQRATWVGGIIGGIIAILVLIILAIYSGNFCNLVGGC